MLQSLGPRIKYNILNQLLWFVHLDIKPYIHYCSQKKSKLIFPWNYRQAVAVYTLHAGRLKVTCKQRTTYPPGLPL